MFLFLTRHHYYLRSSFATNGKLKKSFEDFLEGPFEDIVAEVEMLKTKFQKGEEKETCMQPFGKKPFLPRINGQSENKRYMLTVDKVSECYQSLTAHQHQKGHTVPKQVITITTSIQVAKV